MARELPLFEDLGLIGGADPAPNVPSAAVRDQPEFIQTGGYSLTAL